MALKADLENAVERVFKSAWTERNGQVVPEPSDLKLANDAIKLTGTVLYADLADSTSMVNSKSAQFAAEIYKTFLHCAARIITSEGGIITSYDGDRVMAVFIGSEKNSAAARAGLKINWATKNIVQVKMKKQYPEYTYVLKHTVGIDTSELYVARTGIRGSNDLVWVGRAANYAAKLSDLPSSTPTWITKNVYDSLNLGAKTSNGKDMWQERTWTQQNNKRIYCSNYWWELS